LLRVLFSLLAFSAARAAGGPNWPQFRASAGHAGFSPLAGPPRAAVPEMWRLPSPDGSAIVSSPALTVDGTAIFLTQGGAFVAARPLQSAPWWTYKTASPLAGESSPAISAGVNTYVASAAYLYCIVVSTGAVTQIFSAAALGYGNTTFPPTLSDNGVSLAVPTSSGVLIFSSSCSSFYPWNPTLVISGLIPSGPVSSVDNDPLYAYCLFFVTSANAAVKLCPQSFSPSVPVWSFPLSEPSPFAPVVVASLGAVFFVTGGPGAFVSGVAAFGSANTSVCAGQFGSALGGAPAWVGGSFGLAAVSSQANGGAAVLLTGPLPISSCALAASVAGTPPSAGSASPPAPP
jgi:hypothetical protein